MAGRSRASARRPRRAGAALALAAGAVLGLAAGCGPVVRFPTVPLIITPTDEGVFEAYDTDGDRRVDYFTYQDRQGRKVRIAYDTTHDGRPDAFVDLDSIPPANCRHVVLILDGIGFDTVEAFRKEGHLRLFHPPARVISTFPAMTDVALADVFRSVPCVGQEAVYFDHRANRLAGGDADYLSLRNENWARFCDYRAGTLVDPLAYLFPGHYFGQELRDVAALFDRRDRPQIVAYVVSVAGLGTKHLLQGQHEVLELVDRFAEELVWKTRGLVQVTLLSDHGHTLVRGRWIDFPAYLREKGWRVRNRLQGPRDVAAIEYGLISHAAFAARDRPGLAATLLEHEGVDLVAYTDGKAVVVASADGSATIERRGDRYRYRAARGDPLGLLTVLETMRAAAAPAGPEGPALDADGFVADRALLEATAVHRYPDPLDRLWRCFHGQTENVPDVIASLKEGHNSGLPSRAIRFPHGASTHGDLAYKSSTAFLLSTAGETDGVWRMRDLAPVLARLTGRPWPPPYGGHAR